MKIKVFPEDFRVDEKLTIETGSKGKFSIYRLEKRNWSTLDLVDYLKRNYSLSSLRYAGLKDRYAHSFQYVSILGEGPKKIAEKNFSLTFLGKSDQPVRRHLLIGNSFRIVLRDLTESDIPKIKSTLEIIKKEGLPNYFDEQRFGSIRHRRGFFAQKLILGHFNGALKLYLATPSGVDAAKTRENKKFLAEHWGDWKTVHCRPSTVNCSEFRPVLSYLVRHPKDFKGAVRQINRKLLEMFVVAYQSYLWNEILSELLRSFNLTLYHYPYLAGTLFFYQELPKSAKSYLTSLLIPTPSYKTSFQSEKIERITDEVLSREGLLLKSLKIPVRIKGIFFKTFLRRALVFPEKLSVQESAPDEFYEKKLKLGLAFFLPKGSYATILVKRLQVAIEKE
jgi:tRNA pseudouridine13 synthase